MNKKEVYKAYRDKYSDDERMSKAIEELGELVVECARFKNGRGDVRKLAEEICDVYIVTEQLIETYDIEREVNQFIGVKVDRMRDRLNA